MIRRFDAWLGARIFVPIVIWICQRANTTQWRFSNYGWMLASWLMLYAAMKRGTGETLPFIVAVYCTVIAARQPDKEGLSFLWLRMVFAVGEFLHWSGHALYEAGLVDAGFLLWGVDWDASCPVGLIILAAEYALTIRTIPPRETRSTTSRPALEAAR
jgi:hypothetical protein